MFSLGSRAVQDGHVVGSVIQRDADQAIRRALAGIKGGVQGVSSHIVPTFSVLRSDALAEATRRNVTNAEAIVDNGRVFLVLDALATAAELEETVFHELYRHAGLH